ncbi:MAG TPA: TolC family protein [Candidatus Binataceae bacterium]|nr:TolC family protein [Candidatus Binataceae bacterium]
METSGKQGKSRSRRGRAGRGGYIPPLVGAALAFTLALASAGCTYLNYFREQPEIQPDRYAPDVSDRSWVAPAAAHKEYAVPVAIQNQNANLTFTPSPLNPPTPATVRQSLPTLIDISLTNNPDTRRTWENARAAAAAYGASRSPYYPLVSVGADAGYQRLLFQTGPRTAAIQQWQVEPMMNLTYTLADFGRRSSDAEIARQRLAASNFVFNRTMQNVVFGVQRSFYALAAAEAAVQAAQENVQLATTDLEAVQQRLNLGLATQPALLLAKERKAQSEFELENTKTLVNDSRAALAVAIGVPANQPLDVESLQNQSVPKTLGQEVDALIATAVRERPDLSAQVANLRESEAEQARARADWFPTVTLGANYTQSAWWYNFNGAPININNQPQYAALLGVQWDLFTGFRRLNDDRRTEAQHASQRESVRSLELETIAEVWRTYYDFQTAVKRYEFAQALLAAAQESYDDNIETYRQGLSTIVELLTADRDLANARFTMIQATAQVLTSSAAVANAVGAVTPGR